MHRWSRPQVIAIAALWVGAAIVRAQASNAAPALHIGGGLTVGVVDPVGSSGALHQSGFWGTGLLDLFGRSRRVGLRVEGSYGSMDGRRIRAGRVSIADASLRVVAGTANIVWMTRPRVFRMSPYLMAGVGLCHTSDGRTGHAPGVSDMDHLSATNLGVNVGGGLEWRRSGYQLFIEARLHNVFRGAFDESGHRASARFVPIVAGFRVGGL